MLLLAIPTKWKRRCVLALLALASAAKAQSNAPYVGTDAAGNFHVNASESE